MTSSSSSVNSKDPGWKTCYLKNPGDKNAVTCNYCHKETKGGICRQKQHIVGGFRNTTACTKVPPAVKEEIRAYMESSKKKKSDRNAIDASYEYEDLANSDDDIGVEEVAITGSSAAKKPRTFGPMDTYVTPSGKKRKMVQSTINAQMKKEKREIVVQKIARWFYQAGIAFNTAKLKSFQDMIQEIGEFGPGLKAPSYHELRVPLLKKEVNYTKEFIEKQKEGWKNFGCTVMADGWKDRRNRSLVNFMVNCPLGTVFLESVDASHFEKTGERLCQLFERVFEKVGVENIVQVVTDNGSNFVLAGRLLEQKYRHIFWTPCAAHCLDLMLEDFAKHIKTVQTTIGKAMKMCVFIYNHGGVLNMMRNFTKNRELVRPSVTRFCTSFLTLQSIHQHKNALREMFTSNQWVTSKWSIDQKGKKACDTALHPSFWNNVLYVLKLSAPIVKVLRLVDSDEKPSMGYIYEAMSRAKEAIKISFNGDTKKYEKAFEIIDRRWNDQLKNPLHAAAYFLNPAYFYSDPTINRNVKVNTGLLTCIEKLIETPEEQDIVSSELDEYRAANGLLGNAMAIRQRTLKQPALWWSSYGMETPNLQRLAIRVLSLTSSASGCERNWSVFEHIHTKRRNRLEQKRLNDLVFVRYNQRLKERFQKRGKFDPISLDSIDDCDEWIANGAEEDEVFEGEGLTWGDVAEASGLNLEDRPNTRNSSSRGKEPMIEEESEAEEEPEAEIQSEEEQSDDEEEYIEGFDDVNDNDVPLDDDGFEI